MDLWSSIPRPRHPRSPQADVHVVTEDTQCHSPQLLPPPVAGKVKTPRHYPRVREDKFNNVHNKSKSNGDGNAHGNSTRPRSHESPLDRPSASRTKTSTPPADQQSQTRSPQQLQPSVHPPGSDAGSLNVKMGDSSIHDRYANQSTTQTQHSTSLSVKRTGDDMQGPTPKQPFSPSSSRGIQKGYQTIDATHTGITRLASERMSPGATASMALPLYYSAGAGAGASHQDFLKESPHPSSPTYDRHSPETFLVKQPNTRPITEQQLINEVKGIYAGLVMVEKKCVEIVAQQSQSTKRLSDQQWKALVALHRTLLQEHHDFFSASQHPTASETLKKLAIKYAMPARMWRHGIHAFLELLRHRLPDSMEHMLSFIYLSYSMMALLKESVPTFVETWIECLGDLARYRMAIEDTDPRDREIWSNVAKMWYNDAADKSPNVGRIQHHLAVLARPNIVEQLFYYDKALVSVVPFINARESIMLLFDMFVKSSESVEARYAPAEYAFVNTYAILFTRRGADRCGAMLDTLTDHLGGHIDRTGARFKLQGPQMASALFAGLLDFGKNGAYLWRLYSQQLEEAEARKKSLESPSSKGTIPGVQHMHTIRQEYWSKLTLDTPVERLSLPSQTNTSDTLADSEAVAALAAPITFKTITLVASRIGDKNGVPFMHVVLAMLWDMAFVPGALVYIEACIPWIAIILFLNTLGRSGISYANVEADAFAPSHGGHGRQLTEDFLMRGMMTTRHYYEPEFFAGPLVDEDERTIELPSHQAPRAERCLWLGVRLAKLGRYITYDGQSKMFETTEFARSLATAYV